MRLADVADSFNLNDSLGSPGAASFCNTASASKVKLGAFVYLSAALRNALLLCYATNQGFLSVQDFHSL